MRLSQLAGEIEGARLYCAPGEESTEITAVVHDSREAGPGCLFCCVPGAHHDGHDFAAAAGRQGAAALVVEHALDSALPQVVVGTGRARTSMAQAASALYGHPSRSMRMVGVTGTNGKTTVTYLVRSILAAHGWRCSVLGTLGGARTTPDAPALQQLLAHARDTQHAAVAMEVSSHALVQRRVDAIVFDVAAFTNLTQDHLDYHGDMDRYFAAKASLFTPARCRHAVVHTGDAYGCRLADRVAGEGALPLTTVGADDAGPVRLGGGGVHFIWRGQDASVGWGGLFTVEDALVAASCAEALGVDDRTIVEGLAAAPPVPGRFEMVVAASPASPAVVVDYAHTPAGLAAALRSARVLAAGEVIVVFGCGGERDAAKRPMMGEVASDLADMVVITSDNPRSEDPEAIITAVTAGFVRDETMVVVEPDRARAIRRAITSARPGDVVLVAGKGHETMQELAGTTVPFDDREVVRGVVSELVSAQVA